MQSLLSSADTKVASIPEETSKPFASIPSPPSVPLLGHLLDIARGPVKTLLRYAEECDSAADDGILRLSLPSGSLVVVWHPDAVQEIYERDDVFQKVAGSRGTEFAKSVLGVDEEACIVLLM